MVETRRQSNGTTITLRPNRSATWPQTRLLLALLCTTTLAVGLLWSLAGVWMVLPFSGLEAALVAYLLHRVCRQTYRQQVVTCRGDAITVEIGCERPQRRWRFSRRRARLALSQPRHPLDPAQLAIYDREQRVELGDFLNREDKQLALAELRRHGLQVRTYTDTSRAA